jgi:glycine/serine hydroxymethyltransferase
MEEIVTLIDQVLLQADNESVITETREQVKELMKQFPLYPELS